MYITEAINVRTCCGDGSERSAQFKDNLSSNGWKPIN